MTTLQAPNELSRYALQLLDVRRISHIHLMFSAMVVSPATRELC